MDADDLTTLLDYEKAHANRFQVVTVMKSRLASLKNGAQPSGGAPSAATARGAPPARGLRLEGLRGDVRPACEPAAPRRPSNR